MSFPVQLETQILFEIAMSIGKSLDLHDMTKEALRTYLRKLNCPIGAVYKLEDNACHLVTCLPRRADHHPMIKSAMIEFAEQGGVLKDVFIHKYKDSDYLYVFPLKDFGVLLLARKDQELDEGMVRSLASVNEKLAGACISCEQQTQLANALEKQDVILSEVESIANELTQLIDNANAPIFGIDANGKVNEWNKTAEKITGFTKADVLGRDLVDNYINVEYRESVRKILNDALNGIQTSNYEFPLFTKDNRKVMVLLNSTTRRDPQGKIVGVLGVGQDITELKKVQNEMESLLQISNQQNDRLRNFAYIVSHNLRSHSGGISGILELVETIHPELWENDFIKHIHKASKNLEQTIQDLTEIVKINLTEVKDVQVNIYDLLKKNIESLRSRIQQTHFKIINTVEPNLVVNGVTAYLDSILLNFMTNAIKYRSKERNPYLKIYTNDLGSKVEIYFEDNGLGIDLKKDGHKLFGMYKTFHEHKDSRGLGLFITKNQIESMDGKVEVESEVNVGTTFKITLKK